MGFAWDWSRVRVPFWAIRRSVVLEPSLNRFFTFYSFLCFILLSCLLKTLVTIAMPVAIPSLVLASLLRSQVWRGIPMHILRRYVSCLLFRIQPLMSSRLWSVSKPLKRTRGIVRSGWETSTSTTWFGTSPWCRFDVWRHIDRLIFWTQMMPFTGGCYCKEFPTLTLRRGLMMPRLGLSGICQENCLFTLFFIFYFSMHTVNLPL